MHFLFELKSLPRKDGMKKILLLIASLTLLSSAMTFADTTSKRQVVIELLESMQMDSMMDAMYSQMDGIFINMGRQMNVQASEQAIFERYTQKMTAAMKAEMSWAKMKEPMADIYLKHYSEKELAEMLAFYRSETGKAMVEKMPAVMADSVPISQTMLQNVLPKIESIGTEMEQALEAARLQ